MVGTDVWFNKDLADGADDEDTGVNVGAVDITGAVEFKDVFVDGECDVALTADGEVVVVGIEVMFDKTIADGADDEDMADGDDVTFADVCMEGAGEEVTAGVGDEPVTLDVFFIDGADDEDTAVGREVTFDAFSIADGADDKACVGKGVVVGVDVRFETDCMDGEDDIISAVGSEVEFDVVPVDGAKDEDDTPVGDGVTVGKEVAFIDEFMDGADDDDDGEEDEAPVGDGVTVGNPVALEEDCTDGADDGIADGMEVTSIGPSIAKTNALPAVSVLFLSAVATTKVSPLLERATLPAKSLMSRAASPFFIH